MSVYGVALRRVVVRISGLVAAAAFLLAVPGTAWGAYSITGAWSGQIMFHIQNNGDTFNDINLTAPMGVTWTGSASVDQVGGTCGHSSTVLGCQSLSVTNGQSINITASTTPSPVASSTVFSATVDNTTTFSGPFMIGMASPPPAPSAQLTPAMLDFGSVPIGTTSAPKVVTLTNSGGATLHIGSLTVTPPFAIRSGGDGCGGQSIAPNGHCNVSIVFSPTAGGLVTGTLKFADDASDSPQTEGLSGTGSAPTCAGFPEFPEPPGCADVAAILAGPYDSGGVANSPGHPELTPRNPVGFGESFYVQQGSVNHGPDPTDVVERLTVTVNGKVIGDGTSPSAPPKKGLFLMQGGDNEFGGGHIGRSLRIAGPGFEVITETSTGSIPDPDGSNNTKSIDFTVYPFPASTAKPPGPEVKGGRGGQLGGSTDSCGEAKPPAICSGRDDTCVDTDGCVQSHHDVCQEPAGTLGPCTRPPTSVCSPPTSQCSGSPKPAQQPLLGRTAPAVPTAVQAASAFNPALERVSKVRVALVAVGKGGHAAAAKPCRWLTAKGKLRAAACNKPVWVKAKGTTHWKLRVPRLPPGSYVEYVQAANAAGIAEDTFGPKDRNRIAFRVR